MIVNQFINCIFADEMSMLKAIINCFYLYCEFNYLFRKLLEPPVIPSSDLIPVGIAKEPSLDDLAEIMPVRYHLYFILE